MADDSVSSVLGYGLFGFGIGLTIFSVLYLFLMRSGVAQPRSATWLLILLAIVLVPAVIGAAVGAVRARRSTPPTPY